MNELKNIMSESEMEVYLLTNGYDIEVGEGDDRVIDSTKVIDCASDLGYISFIVDDINVIEFRSFEVSEEHWSEELQCYI